VIWIGEKEGKRGSRQKCTTASTKPGGCPSTHFGFDHTYLVCESGQNGRQQGEEEWLDRLATALHNAENTFESRAASIFRGSVKLELFNLISKGGGISHEFRTETHDGSSLS
jgi:hypothetical protein